MGGVAFVHFVLITCVICALARPSSTPPLCAIGDLHGDEAQALQALRLCGAVDESGKWTGGTMTVVQTGDVIDRGNASLPLLRKLWALRDDAAAAGGELLLLMGNHELLNMQGMTRYVHRGELAANGGESAWLRALNPRGEIGKQLAALPGAVVRGEGACRTLFLHAGLRLKTAQSFSSLDALNAELTRQATANAGELLDARTGPLWWRGYARPHAAGLSENEACAEARQAIETLGDGAVRMGVGHNIVPFVSTRCNGVMHMLDVGMSYAYGGRPAAWQCSLDAEMGGATVRALYIQGAETPPDLCEACGELLGAVRSSQVPLRGVDPHGDCPNYCSQRRPVPKLTQPTRLASSAMLKGAGGAEGLGFASLMGSWSGSQADASGTPHKNHVKTEF